MVKRLTRLTVAWALLLFCLGASHESHAQSVQIIVNPGVAKVDLDRDLLRAIFTMRLRSWPNGAPVHVFVLPDSDPISDRFYREQLGMYSYVLRSAWDRMVYTGTGLAPTIVRSEKEMRERVSATPGAIGYVSRARDSSFLGPVPPTMLTALVDWNRR
jgi:ABC-type phosphate transport system substrate-binding protein